MPTSEFDLIYRYFAGLGAGSAVALSVGDDCALLQPEPNEQMALSVDTAIEGVHFPVDAFPEDIALRAVGAAASDLAAMGARPLGMTLALTLPEVDELWLHAFSQGLAEAVTEFELPLVGGDTTCGALAITISVFGAVPQDGALLRSGACPGDRLCVSGTLGDAAAGFACLEGDWQPGEQIAEYLEQRYYRPRARLALGQQLRGVASAAIDISDGLLADAGHLAAASDVAIKVHSALIPLSDALRSHPDPEKALRWALSWGDDYELCFTLPEGLELPEGCTIIGVVEAGEGVTCDVDITGLSAGYSHF